MNKKLVRILKSVNWGSRIKRLNWLVVLVLLVSALPTPSTPVLPTRVQPILLELAARQPDEIVSIIVQKTVKDNSLEGQVVALGGKVTADLSIIAGFAAELKAKDVVPLSQVAGVRWISFDAPFQSAVCAQCVDTSNLKNAYIQAIHADQVWNQSPYLQGQDIGVAVVDSGIRWQDDLYTIMGVNRVVAQVSFNDGYNPTPWDNYGHGTFVAGVIGGNGRRSNGAYIGVAPMVNLINVKVSDDLSNGQSTAKTVVQGLQWILDNKDAYNIRVVNLSLNSTVAESYHTNPIDAAVEILWFNKIVVVTSVGNSGSGKVYPPANDPFVITVGAADDRGTGSLADDVVASFSGYGVTVDGFAKPDLVAPGKNIVSLMGNYNGGLPSAHPGHVVHNDYFRVSGTSASAPMVAAAAALVLQSDPELNPDQIKFRLMATANTNWPGYNLAQAGAGYLDVYAAVTGTTTQTANTGTTASQLLWTGDSPPNWDSMQWGSMQWGSLSWDSVNWSSMQWGSMQWGSDYWGP